MRTVSGMNLRYAFSFRKWEKGATDSTQIGSHEVNWKQMELNLQFCNCIHILKWEGITKRICVTNNNFIEASCEYLSVSIESWYEIG